MATDFTVPAPSAAAREVPILDYGVLDVADTPWWVNTSRTLAQLGCPHNNGYLLVTASDLFTDLKD